MAVSNRHRLALLVLLLLVVAAKLPTLSTPFFWDETSWIARAHRVAELPPWKALPGYSGTEFTRRPPGLFLPMGLAFKLVGTSTWLPHACIVGFALLGLYYTYRLAEWCYGANAGMLAALFLSVNAIFFAQAGMFLPDLPVAACGVASVYAMLRSRWAQYVFWALWLVLMKETALALVTAIALYALWRERQGGIMPALGAALRWGFPLLPMAIYYGVQKATTGRMFVDFAALGEPAGFFDPRLALSQFRPVTSWLFAAQMRWIFTGLILANLIVHRRERQRPELMLFLLIALCSGYAFIMLYFLPRYLLPVAPYFYVLAAGALVAFVPRPRWQAALGAALVALSIAQVPGKAEGGNHEWDMGYLAATRMYQATAVWLETHAPDARIATTWPLSEYLGEPKLGYVARPLNAVPLRDLDSAGNVDVIVVTSLGDSDRKALEHRARRSGWPRVQHLEDGVFRSDIYARSLEGGAPSPPGRGEQP
jgi:hypothetical protein